MRSQVLGGNCLVPVRPACSHFQSVHFLMFLCVQRLAFNILFMALRWWIIIPSKFFVFLSKKITTWRPEELQKMSDQVIEKEEREKERKYVEYSWLFLKLTPKL